MQHLQPFGYTSPMDKSSGHLVTEIRGAIAQDELAKRAGFSRASLSRWETEVREPSLAELARLARAAGKRLETVVVDEADPEHVELVHELLEMNAHDRMRRLAGDRWPALCVALDSAAWVSDFAIVIGPVAAALRGAPQRVGYPRVDLLVRAVDAERAIEALIGPGDAHPDGIEETRSGEGATRQLFYVRGGGSLSLIERAPGASDFEAVFERSVQAQINGVVGYPRFPLVEDLLEIAEASPWPEDAPLRAGLRAVLSSGRYSSRRAVAEFAT